MVADSVKPRFLCSQCEKSFSRAEHLTRHQALHDGSQSYGCEHCPKTFPRKDALTRHILTHDGGPNLLEKKARACRGCARAKVRCSGSHPCARCTNKDIECEFPQAQSKASPTMTLPSPESENQLNDVSDGTLAQQSMSVLHLIESNPSVVSAHEDVRSVQGYDQPPTSPAAMRTESISTQAFPVDARMSVSTTNGLFNVASSYEGDQRFDPGYWTPNVLSSINWLPMSPPGSFNYDNMVSPGSMLPREALALEQLSANRNARLSIQDSTGTPRTQSSATDSIGHRTTGSGEFYLDGNAGRLPRVKRQKIIARRPSEVRHRNAGLNLRWVPPRESPTMQHFADFEYDAMHNAFLTLCVNCTSIMPSFIGPEFPPPQAFDYLLDLFFKHIHPSLPFVHRPTFNPDHEGRWILLLSMASISCWFLEDETSEDFAESMLEFFRRVTLWLDSSNSWQRTFTNCRQAQIRLLFLLSASASKHEGVRMWSDRCMGELCQIVTASICQSYPKGEYQRSNMPPNAEWLVWSEDEQTRRTAFLVWKVGLLRFMQHPDARPPMTLASIASIRLPCTDEVFQADDPEVWQQLEAKSSAATFLDALQNLYIDKRLLPDLGDFSHIIIIYGVIQRTREIQEHVQQPLSRFEPSAERRKSTEVDSQPVWAPGVPLYMKWRNSACDCLDILHWQANAAVGLAGGLEPAKVMHLHFARVLMLAPLDDLLSFARLINFPFRTPSDAGGASPEEYELRRSIQRWTMSDQYKARLAAIHAGVTFWHVRRYSTNSHCEPFAVLAATLTLWALSAFTPKSMKHVRSPGDIEEDNDSSCDIILIDRPTDDELVQRFVRQGQNMKVHMSGVDDLWSPSAPFKVLKEGMKLLLTLGAWSGETERAIGLLEGLMSFGRNTEESNRLVF